MGKNLAGSELHPAPSSHVVNAVFSSKKNPPIPVPADRRRSHRSGSQMMRFPQLLSWQLRWRGWLAICWAVLGRHLTQVRRLQGCPSNVIEWNRLRERRQVVFTNLRHRLESGRQFDQGRLAECCSTKADTERNS